MKLKSLLYKKYIQMKESKIYTQHLQRKKKAIEKKYHAAKIDAIISHLNAIEDLYIPAAITHQKVFPKYKGINKGKTVVLIGTGPTLDYYKPIQEETVNIGVNRAFMREDILLDYLFSADRDKDETAEKMKEQYKGNNCIKFYPYIYRGLIEPIPNHCRDDENAESFYVLSYNYSVFGHDLSKDQFFVFPPDLSVSPLKSYGTTMFSAFQFALWTHPDKIFLVGCDCSNGHSTLTGACNNHDFGYLINPWKKAKEFAAEYYPDIEITSINPVGLKGIFNDIYTDNYKESVKESL